MPTQQRKLLVIENFNDIRNKDREKYFSFVKKEIKGIKKYIDGFHSREKRTSRGIFLDINPSVVTIERVNKVELIIQDGKPKTLIAFRVKLYSTFLRRDHECVISLIHNRTDVYGKVISIWEKSSPNATFNRNHKKIKRSRQNNRRITT
jgi:hypothetical protein